MILASLSGGRTSGFMNLKLIEKYGKNNVISIFANTGLEHSKTYEFVKKLEGLTNLIIIEAMIHERRGVGTGFKIVEFDEMTRGDDLFDRMCNKYGLMNNAYFHCTRELKEVPIQKFRKAMMLDAAPYALGIRADEIDRVSVKAKDRNIIYPLISDFETTKKDVLDFWSNMPFDLDLPEHLGNCVTCYKKSAKKLLTIAKDSPEHFKHFDQLETKYKHVKEEGRLIYSTNRFKGLFPDGEDVTVKSLVGAAQLLDFDTFKDDYYEQSNGCSEHCEPFSGEN